jgi:hypothetical protein
MKIENLLSEIEVIRETYVESAKAVNDVVNAINSVHNSSLINTHLRPKVNNAIGNVYDLQKIINIEFIALVEHKIKSMFNLKFSPFVMSDRVSKIVMISDSLVIETKFIIDNIEQQCGNFIDGGLSQTKYNLRWYIEKAKRSAYSVSLPQLVPMDSWYLKNYDRLYASYTNSNNLDNIYRLLTYFDQNTLTIASSLSDINTKDFGTDEHQMKDMNKVQSLRFFKNGKLTINFKTKEDASNFFEFIKS